MKRLIVCFDGTWNNPEQEDNGVPAPTNVFKIKNAMADTDANGVQQLKYYHPGIGGEHKGVIAAVLGGAIGAGISRHIKSGYHWLATHYEDGDEIYLYGFSRGAFTARSLGGMLGHGLLDLREVPAKSAWERVNQAYSKGYRKKRRLTDDWSKPNWNFFNQKQPIPIHFIGVWDTVGALGVPDDLEVLNLLDSKDDWEFHNTSLGENVAHARHAIAIDEIRASFTETRWSNASSHADAIELWFPGVHSDVGGGYADTDLSHGALKWMIEESEAVGLAFRDGVAPSIVADPGGKMHNSFKGLFAKLRSRPRNIPPMTLGSDNDFHQSAVTRQQHSPIDFVAYHPTKILAVNESVSVEIHADTRWNVTNVYFPEGHGFIFSATGEWLDSKDSCNWKGAQNDDFTLGDIMRGAASLWGKTEGLWGKLTHNRSTDFVMTKRIEQMNWFVMVGAISNDAGLNAAVGNDGSPVPHQYVDLTKHESTPLKVESPGYLYCFPNDVWSLYGNNHGSVKLMIKRVA